MAFALPANASDPRLDTAASIVTAVGGYRPIQNTEIRYYSRCCLEGTDLARLS